MEKFWREEIESYKLKPFTAMVAAGMTGEKRFLASYGVSAVLQAAADMINDKWTYKIYRTKEQIATGYGGKQFTYKYQGGSFSANFRFLKYTTPKWTIKGKTGSRWFSSKLF